MTSALYDMIFNLKKYIENQELGEHLANIRIEKVSNQIIDTSTNRLIGYFFYCADEVFIHLNTPQFTPEQKRVQLNVASFIVAHLIAYEKVEPMLTVNLNRTNLGILPIMEMKGIWQFKETFRTRSF